MRINIWDLNSIVMNNTHMHDEVEIPSVIKVHGKHNDYEIQFECDDNNNPISYRVISSDPKVDMIKYEKLVK